MTDLPQQQNNNQLPNQPTPPSNGAAGSNPVTTQNPNLRPMNQPHIPISEAEMNPNLHHDSPKSGKGTLLTLASLLVLAGIVGVTLYLYIQNRSAQPSRNDAATQKEKERADQKQNADQIAAIPTMTQEQQKEIYGDVVCRRFTSIEEALQVPEIACVLDLSGQELSELPEYITKLTKLNELNLSNNNFTEFPKILYGFKTLLSINLENNKITSMPSEDIKTKIPNLQVIRLEGNKLPNDVIEKYLQLNAVPPQMSPTQQAPKEPVSR